MNDNSNDSSSGGKNITAVSKNTRLGSSDDAFTLLSILMREHRDAETDEIDQIDVNEELLDNNKLCRERFNQWLQKTSAEQVPFEFPR